MTLGRRYLAGMAKSVARMLLALVVGLVVSIFQAVTSIQEQSLSFIPKIVGVAVLIVVLGPWMLDQLVTYAQNLYMSIPSLIG